MVGQAVGSFLFATLSDKFGRKPTYVGCHVSMFLVTLATSFTPNYVSFVVMRFLTGAFMSVCIFYKNRKFSFDLLVIISPRPDSYVNRYSIFFPIQTSVGECNTIVSAYTNYRHLG